MENTAASTTHKGSCLRSIGESVAPLRGFCQGRCGWLDVRGMTRKAYPAARRGGEPASEATAAWTCSPTR